ncbi:MAG: hypothetical protein K9G72_20050 [Rhodobacteraceae bacterium]|nr:hypothetical protein [Paracoccaceae bacterium]
MTGTALAHWPHDDEATTTTGAETCGTVVQALLVWLDVGTVGATTGAETAGAETAGVVAGTLLVWPHVRLYDGTVVVGTDDQVVQRLLVFPDAGEDDTTVGAGAGDGVAATLLGVGTDATTVGCETTAEVAEIPLAWP